MKNALHKFALLTYIADSMSGKHALGKKALQKLVHLCGEIGNVNTGYKFKLYTYGPFSRELAGDVDILDSMSALSVRFDAVRNGYEITVGEKADDLIGKASGYLNENKEKIDYVISIFGDRLAKQLELSSMLIFILKNDLVDDPTNDAEVIDKFLEIKPHYEYSDVVAGLSEVRSLI